MTAALSSLGASLDADIAQFILRTLQTRLPEDLGEPLLTDRELEILSLLDIDKNIVIDLKMVFRP